MPSRSKTKQTPKRKRIDWKNLAFIIFGLVMVVAMIISAFAQY
jgi:nitrate reductase NapE component